MDNFTIIPTNYSDAGKLFGMFAIRNTAECICICAPLLMLLLLLSPFGLTGTVILTASVVVPVGGFTLMGIRDDSLFRFIRCYRRYRRYRHIYLYKGGAYL